MIIIISNKKKAMKRNIKRRAKFREKPFAARLHEQSAEAAFELWTESNIMRVHSNGSPPLQGARYTIYIKYRMSAG